MTELKMDTIAALYVHMDNVGNGSAGKLKRCKFNVERESILQAEGKHPFCLEQRSREKLIPLPRNIKIFFP
jgi:hypothetical protein